MKGKAAMLLIPLLLTILVSISDYIIHGDLTYKFSLVSIGLIWLEYLSIALADVCLGW